MTFERSPLWLFTLIVVWGAMLWGEWRRRQRLARLLDREVRPFMVRGPGDPRRGAILGLRALGWAGLVVAALGPTWGYEWEEVPDRGRDWMVVLDVSASMRARDLSPDRLTWAKRKVRDLMRLSPGDRVGVVAFAGVAFLACPLTADPASVELFLEPLSEESVSGGGTALAEALALAGSRLGAVGGGHVLVLSDGEDHLGGVEKAARDLKAQGVRVSALGVGTPTGAPVPDGQGFKKAPGGELVVSRLQEPLLEQAAREGGGLYLRTVAGDGDLTAVLALGGESREAGARRQRRPLHRFGWFLGFGVLSFLLAQGLGGLRWQGVRRRAAVLAALWLSWGAWADPHQSYREEKYDQALEALLERQARRPDDPRVNYDLGHVYYRMGRFDEAEAAFGRAMEGVQGKEKAQAAYNRGNAAFRRGQFDEAIAQYETALALDPSDTQAQHNKALALRKKEEAKQPPPQGGDGDPKNGERSDDKSGDKTKGSNDRDSKEESPASSKGDEGKPPTPTDPKGAEPGDSKGESAQKGVGNPEKLDKVSEDQARLWLQRVKEGRPQRRVPKNPAEGSHGKDW